MKDTLYVIGVALRHLVSYPLAVIKDFVWFKLNYRPRWLEAWRNKSFDRMDAEKIRLGHIVTRFRFWIKRTKDTGKS